MSAINVDNNFDDQSHAIRKSVLRKLNLRIVFFCFILYMVNYLDRVNVGFAALHMNKAIGLSPVDYGFGAGIFFVGYVLFEIPSNMLLYKVGPRLWISRILVTWGIVSCCMALVQGSTSFYTVRFLLGLAEAGFVPGVLLYLTYWFPADERAKATAGFMTATVLSTVVGAPLSGWILSSNPQWFGLASWQWLFILEGVPSILLGIICFFYLVDQPKGGRWLNQQEQEWLLTKLAQERSLIQEQGSQKLSALFRDYRVWLLTFIYMFYVVALYGIVLWLPQIIRSIGGLSDLQVGCLTAVPFLSATCGLLVVARHSDKTGERKWHTVCAAIFGGIFLALSAVVHSPLIGLLFISVAAFGIWAVLGVFWSLPTQFLSGRAAAGGLAAINGFAQIGGAVGPYLVGWIKASTHSFTPALLALAAGPIIAGLLCMAVKVKPKPSVSRH